MWRSLSLVCSLCCSLVSTSAWAQPGGEDAGRFGPPASPERHSRLAANIEDDLRPIQIEIAILDVPASEIAHGPLNDEQQFARLEKLETEGKLAGVQRMKTALLANQLARFQMGEMVAMVTGRTSRPNFEPGNRGGGFAGGTETRTMQNFGTMISVIARPVAGGAVADLTLERSGVVPQRQPEAADAPAGDIPRSHQLTIKTTALFADGERKIVSSHQHAKPDGSKEETWVLAKLTVGPQVKPVAQAAIKIFHLQNTTANDAAELISKVFHGQSVRAVADARTNTMLVISAPPETQQEIEAVLMKLDEHSSGKTSPVNPDSSSDAPVFRSRSIDRIIPTPDPLNDRVPASR